MRGISNRIALNNHCPHLNQWMIAVGAPTDKRTHGTDNITSSANMGGNKQSPWHFSNYSTITYGALLPYTSIYVCVSFSVFHLLPPIWERSLFTDGEQWTFALPPWALIFRPPPMHWNALKFCPLPHGVTLHTLYMASLSLCTEKCPPLNLLALKTLCPPYPLPLTAPLFQLWKHLVSQKWPYLP